MKWDSIRHSVILEIIFTKDPYPCVNSALWLFDVCVSFCFFFPPCCHTFQRHLCWAVLRHRSYMHVLYVTKHFWQFYFNTAFVLLSHLFSLLTKMSLKLRVGISQKDIYCMAVVTFISHPRNLNSNPSHVN